MVKRQPNSRARAPKKGNHRGSSLSSLAIPIVVVVVVIVLVAVLLASSQNRRLQAGAAPGDVSVSVPTARAQASSPIPHPGVPRITLQETVGTLEQGQAVLIDVRSRSSYEKAHAAGALSFPEDEIQARLNELSAGKDLILY